VRNGRRAHVALWLWLPVATASGWAAFAAPDGGRAAPAPGEDSAEGGALERLVAARRGELERATRAARDKNPCARGELTMSVLVRPDGAIADARPEPGSQLPDDFLDAVAAALKSWRVPPTARDAPVHVRLRLGPMPAEPPPAALGCEAEILDRGRYNVTELVPGIERGPWWAVCKRRVGPPEVRPVKLRLKRFRSEAAGDEKHEMTGREVIVGGCDDPAFLFRGVSAVKEGPLAAAAVSAKADAWNSTADIALGDARYHLRIDAQAPAADGAPERGWTILLEQGGAAEPLDTGHTTLAPLVRVRWAGDLDGDGRADFVLEDHGDGVSLQLFLSRAASDGRKVRRVATTTYGG
jgi:hypothetical protein